MNLVLDSFLLEHYDLNTIYDIYNDLNNKISSLVDYCIDTCNDQLIIDFLVEINALYKSLIMQQLDTIYYNLE